MNEHEYTKYTTYNVFEETLEELRAFKAIDAKSDVEAFLASASQEVLDVFRCQTA